MKDEELEELKKVIRNRDQIELRASYQSLKAALAQVEEEFGSAALAITLGRLLSLQDKYDTLRADWERMLDNPTYYREQVADDLTEELNGGES